MAKLTRYCFFVISPLLLFYGVFQLQYNIALLGVLLMFFNNIIYALEKLRPRSIFLLFNGMIFVFLLSRPTISFFSGKKWWYFEDNAVIFSLISLYCTLLCLFLGALIAEQWVRKKERDRLRPRVVKKEDKRFLETLQKVALIAYFITTLCYFAEGIDKLLFMHGRAYEDFFVEYVSRLPYFVTVVGAMAKYCLCIFLATMPSKRMAFLPLAVFVLSEVPSLIIGLRNPIVLNVLFAFVYYLVRDFLEGRSNWFGYKERIAVVVGAPAAMFFLSAYNYIRQGAKAVTSSVTGIIVDLFYKQGVSFDVLNIGYSAIPKLPNLVAKNYTFGTIIDYFKHNTLAQNLFGAMDLGSGNSVKMAVYGNSFAHSMSYVTRDDYLSGHGWGTSYILETFADFGYWGVLLFSLLLGMMLIFLIYWMKNGWFARTLVLLVLTKLFFTPRAEAVSSISFLFTIQFWVCLFACYFVARVCCKEYSFVSVESRKTI